MRVIHTSIQYVCKLCVEQFLTWQCLYAVDVAPLNNQFNSKQCWERFIHLPVSSCWPSIPQGSVVRCCIDNISTTSASSGFHLQEKSICGGVVVVEIKPQTELHTTIPIHPQNWSPKYSTQLTMLLFYQIHTTHLVLLICSSCVIISSNSSLKGIKEFRTYTIFRWF